MYGMCVVSATGISRGQIVIRQKLIRNRELQLF